MRKKHASSPWRQSHSCNQVYKILIVYTFTCLSVSNGNIGQKSRYSHGVFRLSPCAPELSSYLYSVLSLIGKCIEIHKEISFPN